MVRILFTVLTFLLAACEPPIPEDEFFLKHLLERNTSKFQAILSNDSLEVQIIYTQIIRDSLNQPHFKSFYYHVDSTQYFYPASTVKLPQVLLAFEKLNELRAIGYSIDKYSPIYHDSLYHGQMSVKMDTTARDSIPTIAHYAKKIMVVSDNDAFNRLYEFVGQKATNEKMRAKGYNVRFLHRLERPLTPDQNRHTEAIRFKQNDSVLYKQSMLINTDSIRPPRKVFKGRGFIRKDSLIQQPFDFTYKNSYPLQEQQEILKAILFPQVVDPKRRFNLTPDDRQFVLQYMSQLPRETQVPSYDKDSTLYDAYCKFLLFGDDQSPIPSSIRIFNKVGDAYGYLIDNAYIVDFENGVEFMLSAVINTNTDGIYNDGKYEYKTIGYPFMRNLGQVIYDYERKRKRQYKPDLSEFQISR
ncbi:MAG: serine hydrolase [Bacteroidetes bacterium]|nr:serine hydrolase [Bacteroidota bacterium]